MRDKMTIDLADIECAVLVHVLREMMFVRGSVCKR